MTRLLLAALLLGLLLVLPQIGCDSSPSASPPASTELAESVRITMPLSGIPELRVELRPNATAVAEKGYVVTLYEKGKFRDYTYINFTQPQLNIGAAVDVYFAATQDEYDAYCKIDAEATRNAGADDLLEEGFVIMIDLGGIFSVTVTERMPVVFATLSRLYVEPDPEYASPWDFYRVVVDIAPTDEARAGQDYEARLWYTNEFGDRDHQSEVVSWRRAEIDSHTISKFYLGSCSKDVAEAVLQASPELEVLPVRE